MKRFEVAETERFRVEKYRGFVVVWDKTWVYDRELRAEIVFIAHRHEFGRVPSRFLRWKSRIYVWDGFRVAECGYTDRVLRRRGIAHIRRRTFVVGRYKAVAEAGYGMEFIRPYSFYLLKCYDGVPVIARRTRAGGQCGPWIRIDLPFHGDIDDYYRNMLMINDMED